MLSTLNSIGINTRLISRPSNMTASTHNGSKGMLTKHHVLILAVVLYGCETWSLTMNNQGGTQAERVSV